jgi:hypothetical protein
MKSIQIISMRRPVLLVILVPLFLLFGCTKGGNLVTTTGPTYTISGNADTQQMVPSGTGSATATFSGWYDENLNVLTFTVSWTTLFTGSDVVTAVKFFGPASAGTTGALLRTVNFSSTSATASVNLGLGGNTGLSPAERSDFYAGKWYYVVYTQNQPNGVVRGQLSAQKNK